MTFEGRITIDLFPAEGAVTIASTRPLNITRQFSGQSPKEVIRSISLLFSTCRAAQSIASAEAFEDALGFAPIERTRRVRTLLILAETAREHTLRILMDWPQFLNALAEPQTLFLQRVMRIDRELSRSLDEKGDATRPAGACQGPTDRTMAAIAGLAVLLEQAVLGESLKRWSERGSLPDLVDWAQTGKTPAARLFRQLADDDLLGAGASAMSPLPPFERSSLAERLFADDADAFIAQPEWEGRPRETSPLARTKDHPLVDSLKSEAGHGLGARLAACLVELSQIPERMVAILEAPDERQPEAAPRGGEIGVAQIEAARGRLVHAVQLADEHVRHYRILAPTEWNFHPEGAAARGLQSIAAKSSGDRASLARLFVTAVDPCVGVDVRVR